MASAWRTQLSYSASHRPRRQRGLETIVNQDVVTLKQTADAGQELTQDGGAKRACTRGGGALADQDPSLLAERSAKPYGANSDGTQSSTFLVTFLKSSGPKSPNWLLMKSGPTTADFRGVALTL